MSQTDTTAAAQGTLQSVPRIGMIGCGAIAESFYLPALAQQPEIMAAVTLIDRDQKRLEALQSQYNAGRIATDYQAVLGEIDGAIIAVPPHLHHPITMDCLNAGVHVLCEKPLANNATDAREMVEAAARNQRALAVNYQRRLIASYVKVKELLDARHFGEPLEIRYHIGDKFRWPTVSGFYFDAKLSPRGVMLDQGAHLFDLMCWWLGGKPEITVVETDSFGGPEAVANVRFRHGRCEGLIKMSILAKYPNRYRIICERGTIEGEVYDYVNVLLTPQGGRTERVRLKPTASAFTDVGSEVITNFIDVLVNGVRPHISGEDVLPSMEFIDECYEKSTRFDMPWYESLETYHAR